MCWARLGMVGASLQRFIAMRDDLFLLVNHILS
jgi:hypothetical protein